MATWLALIALAVSAASAAAADPQPDAAPQAPAVTPDPVPGTAQEPTPPAEQPSPPSPAPTQPSATAPPPATPTPAPARELATKPAAEHHQARTEPRRGDGGVAAARATSMLRIKALLPRAQATAESSSRLFILAAGALLALVLASGSMVSVASRAIKGQLR